MSGSYQLSYYTHAIQHGENLLLFNGISSALIRLPLSMVDGLEELLCIQRPRQAGQGLNTWKPPAFTVNELPTLMQDLFPDLLHGQFFIPVDRDEIAHLQVRTERERNDGLLMVRIATTMDCNFDCYYCYEDKYATHLGEKGCDCILSWIQEQVQSQEIDGLLIDWFGGEPMLNRRSIDYISRRAIELCSGADIPYSAKIISNGTNWPDDIDAFLERTRIEEVQITLDGPARHHNRRRAFKVRQEQETDSFQTVVETIDRLHGKAKINLRINVDQGVGDSVLELVEFFRDKGWLKPAARFYPYLAFIGPVNEHCGKLANSKKVRSFRSQFTAISEKFRDRLAAILPEGESLYLYSYPKSIPINCGAMRKNSITFGPDGYMYKCILDTGDHSRSFDRLPSFDAESSDTTSSSLLPILNQKIQSGSKTNDYVNYDPYNHEKCGGCQYLPVCMGGCPKDQIEQNEFYLEERCSYWENDLDDLLRTFADNPQLIPQ